MFSRTGRRARLIALAGVCLWLLALSSPVRAEEELLDMVAASVGPNAITKSQVVQEARFILLEKGISWAGSIPPELLDKVLQRLVGKELIYQDMERGRVAVEEPGKVPDSEDAAKISELLKRFDEKFSSERERRRFRTALGMDASGLAALLLRNTRIEAYMERRLKLMARVTDQQVERELKRRRESGALSKDAGMNVQELRAFVREALEKEKYNQALEKWLTDLRNRYRVRVLLSFEEAEPAFRETQPEAQP